MQAPFDNIVQHLFHQPSLHSVTVDELENMAQQHPYFAAAHFLLLKKMQDTDHPQFDTQLHKTTLYFNNPLWLQYLLQPETVADFRVSENAPFISDEPAATPVAAEENEMAHTNGYTVASAYQLKEEEVLLEKEQTPTSIEEPAVHQQADTPPQHANGGIMDVITEVFNDEQITDTHLPVFEEATRNEIPDIHTTEAITGNNEAEATEVITEAFNGEQDHAAHPPVFEEATKNETTDIHTAEGIINNNELAETTEMIDSATADTEIFVAAEETPTPEAEESAEPVYATAINENNTAFFHEEAAEHAAETEGKDNDNDAEGLQPINIEEESTAAEKVIVEEKAYEYHVPENNIVEEHTENIPGEIAAEQNIVYAEETPVFANEETIIPVVETPADAQITVEEVQSPIPEEEVAVDTFNEDVTPSVIATIEENNDAVNFRAEEAPVNNLEEIPATIDHVQVEASTGENSSAFVIEKNDAQNADDTDKADTSKETAHEEEKPLFRTIIETPASKHDFLFEPYHTVDYFASQGIKLSKVEANSKDKLGRQLKSFTEWLKSMKKLPQASIDKILSENEESKVVADAIHSIEKKDVITEAMAEVFEKQGMMNEAVGIYQKLSLLNPAKSAYFAAKIEALKH